MTDADPGPTLPLERAVIAGMLLKPEVVPTVLRRIRPEDFEHRGHAAIVEMIADVTAHGGTVDKVTVLDELARRGDVERAGGASYLAQLASVDALQSLDRVEGYVQRLRDVVDRRAARVRLVRAIHRLDSGVGETAEIVRDAMDDPSTGGPDADDSWGVQSIVDLAAEVDASKPRPWLFDPVWAHGDYGVLSAEDKAGKTWAMLDAAVSVAAGLPWLGQFPCMADGPVLVFLGEGGKAKMLRRLRAVAAAKGVIAEELPVRLRFRVPRLADGGDLRRIATELARNPARLVILDPLYLAAAGAKGSDIYAMATILEPLQVIAQESGASLMVAHHWNKTGQGGGHDRSSGVGPGAWGRVLISVGVEQARTDLATKRTSVRLKWQFKGDEIADPDLALVRHVWVDDPHDLTSAMHYEVERVDGPPADPGDGLRPAHRRVLAVLRAAAAPLTVRGIGDQLAADTASGPLKARTIQDALKVLGGAGLASDDTTTGFASSWRALDPSAVARSWP